MTGPIRLPVVGRPPAGQPEAPAGRPGYHAGGTTPDPALTAAGWEHRFVTAGERLTEMVSLYRELGFEVRTEPVSGEGLESGCTVCFSGELTYRAVYTRRPAGVPEAGEGEAPESE